MNSKKKKKNKLKQNIEIKRNHKNIQVYVNKEWKNRENSTEAW